MRFSFPILAAVVSSACNRFSELGRPSPPDLRFADPCFKMKSRFSRLFPYLLENRWTLRLDAVAFVAANMLDVNLLVLLGLATDKLSWDSGPISFLQRATIYLLLGAVVATVIGGGLARFWMRRLIIGVS